METMKDRIKEGKLFSDMGEGMPRERNNAKRWMRSYNRSSGRGLGLIHRFSSNEKDFW